jgi:hypothetical protein
MSQPSAKSAYITSLQDKAREYGITSPVHQLALRGILHAAWDMGHAKGSEGTAELLEACKRAAKQLAECHVNANEGKVCYDGDEWHADYKFITDTLCCVSRAQERGE